MSIPHLVSRSPQINPSMPDHVQVTDDDRGPIISIATWFLMVVMILAIAMRITIKLGIKRSLGFEDLTVIAALVFGLAQSVAISLAVQYGLGKRKSNLDSSALEHVEQARYVANLLFILTIALAKISILQLLGQLTVERLHKRMTRISVYITIAWLVPSFFALAFECGIPSPWNVQSGKCIDRLAFWDAIAPVDILLELVIILLPIWMMWRVHVARAKKIVVVVAFVFRIGVIATTIARLIVLHSYYTSTDFIFDSVSSTIVTQVLLSISIATACIPSLKPFLDAFDSGMLNVNIAGLSSGHGSHTRSLGNTYELQNSRSDGTRDKFRPRPGHEITVTEIGFKTRVNAEARETSSLDSGGSDAMIIKRTDEWDIQYTTSAPSLEPEKNVEDRV